MAVKRAPSNLSKEGKAWWKKLLIEYDISDQGGLLILQTAMEAFDRMRQAQKAIETEGATFADRFNQLKSNPLLTVERDARSQMLAALKQLNFDLEPLKNGPGRPGGR